MADRGSFRDAGWAEFALNQAEGIYTPGAARDHRYRVSFLSSDFAAVLDVGTFDGFYAFPAEHRGAARVLAVGNEQYRLCVGRCPLGNRARGRSCDLPPAPLGGRRSTVEYRQMDAFDLASLGDRFDLA